MSKDPLIVKVLALLRYLQCLQTPLMHLHLWSLVLLIHYCQYAEEKSLRKRFQRIFAQLSAGLLLPNQIAPVMLIDPCSNNATDTTDYLTTEQRLEITLYAQKVLRFLAFEKFHSIFLTETVVAQ